MNVEQFLTVWKSTGAAIAKHTEQRSLLVRAQGATISQECARAINDELGRIDQSLRALNSQLEKLQHGVVMFPSEGSLTVETPYRCDDCGREVTLDLPVLQQGTVDQDNRKQKDQSD